MITLLLTFGVGLLIGAVGMAYFIHYLETDE